MVEKLTFHFLAKALMDIPAVSMPIASSLNLRHLWHCVTKLHILVWPLIVHSTRYTYVMIMLFNQLLDMPRVDGLSWQRRNPLI